MNSRYSDFVKQVKNNNFDKYVVADVLNIYVNGGIFIKHLEDFVNKKDERQEYHGVIFSESYDQDDEGYFGENKVLFYVGDDDESYDILNYNEFYLYIKFSCEFFLERNPSQKEKVEELMLKIKKTYEIK